MAVLEQNPYTYKKQLETLQERQQSAGFSATDYGRVVGMAYSAQAAWDRNITMTAARWAKTKMLGDDTSPRVSREEFAKSYAPTLGLEYKADENRDQLDYRMLQAARFARQNEMINGENRVVSNFASAFGASIFDPVNLIPFALPAKGAKAGISMYTAAGNRTAAAYHQGKLTFKNVLAVNAGLEVPYAFMMNDTGVEDYTQDHAKMAAGMGFLVAGAFGGVHGYVASRRALKVRNARRELNHFNALMESDDLASPLQTAIDDNPTIKQMVMGNPRLRDFIAGKDKDGIYLNADDIRLAVGALNIYMNNRKLIAMRQDIAKRLLRDPNYQNKSMIENRKAMTDKIGRIVEAVYSGTQTKTLTPDDLKLLERYDIELTPEGNVVETSMSRTKASNQPASGHVESYAMYEQSKALTLLEKELSEAIYDEKGNRIPLTPEVEAKIAKLESKLKNELSRFYDQHGAYFDDVEKRALDLVNKSFGLKGKRRKFELDRQVLTSLQDIRKGYYVKGAVMPDQPQIRIDLPHRVLADTNLTAIDSRQFGPNFFFNPEVRNNFISAMYDSVSDGKVKVTPKQVGEMYSNASVDNAFFSNVFTTLMHESIHVLQNTAPDVIRKLVDYADNYKIKVALDQKLITQGYSTSSWLDTVKILKKERPAHLLEWAITQEAYWKVLEKEDKTLYRQFLNFVQDLANTFLRHLGKPEVNFIARPGYGPKKVARDVAKIMSEIRKDTSLSGLLKKAYDETPTPSKLDTDNIDLQNPLVSAERGTGVDKQPALSKTYENNNFINRANEMDKYSADPKKYLEDTISRISQDDTLLPKIFEIAKIKETAKRKQAILDLVEGPYELNIPLTVTDINNIVINLDASMKRSRLIFKIAKLNDPNKILAQLARLKEKGLPLEPAQRLGFLLLQENKSPIEKLTDVRKYLVEEDHAMILRTMHDAAVKGKLTEVLAGKRTAKTKLAQLKTIMDGSRRDGVDLGPSIERQVESQIRKDQLPILDYLTQHDLETIFLGEDVSHYMSSYKKAAVNNPALAKTYGNDLKEASKQMHIDIMTAMSTGRMPKRWEGIPVWEGLVDVIRKTNKGQMAEINYLGVNMRQRAGFSGYSMRYDRAVVASMTQKEFVTKMLRMIDIGRTFRLHGGIMEAPTLAQDKAKGVKKKAYVKFDPQAMLATMYNEIVNGKFELDPDIANPSAVGAFRKSMKIAFKPQYEIDARIEFGNYKSLGRLMLEQIRGRSERIALVKHLGHDANGIIKKVAKDNKLDDGSLSYKTFEATVDQITGVLDNPADVELSSLFKKVRSVSNLAYLAGSGLSTLSDVPLSLATLSFLGMEGRGVSGFADAYKSAWLTYFKGDNKKMRAWFRAQGAGFDLTMRTFASRVVTEDGKGMGWIDFANNAMFELNGLNRFTAAHQQIFIDFLSAGLAKQLRTGKMNDLTMARLTEFGFTSGEIKLLANYVKKTPDGVFRIGPSSIGDNTPLQRKLSGFFSQYMKEAVIEPDAGARAITRLGLQAGTFAGETARIAFQYSSFMLGMSRVVYRRFMHGYTGDKKQQAMRNAHLIAYLGTALAFAYMTTVLKDLSRLKEPISPLDMSENDMLRLLSQSGVLGVLELPLNAQRFGADAAFAPLVGAGKDVLSGDIKQAVDPFLGTNYPLIGPLMKKVSFVASETINNITGDELERAQNLRAMQTASE